MNLDSISSHNIVVSFVASFVETMNRLFNQEKLTAQQRVGCHTRGRRLVCADFACITRAHTSKVATTSCFILCALAFLRGQLTLALPPAPDTAPFTFEGIVHIDLSDVKSINPICRKLSVAWVCNEGQTVAKGDPIVIYDTSILQAAEAIKRYDLRVAEARLTRDKLRMQGELQQLKDEQAALELELAVVRASLRRARHVDQDKVSLFEAEYNRDVELAENQRRAQDSKEELFELGELTEAEMATVRLLTAKTQSAAELSHLNWKRESDRIDTLDVARLELKERELQMKLGTLPDDDENSENQTPQAVENKDQSGIMRRIAALEHKTERERTKNQTALDRARKEYHDAVRDAYDHTPLTFIEITKVDADDKVRRIAFQPQDAPTQEDYEIDDGSPFEQQRGYGWDRDLRMAVHLRDVDNALEAGVILIRDQATWRCLMPDGEYRLRLGVGDSVDWHCPMIKIQDRFLFLVDHLKEREIVEETVTVNGGALELIFGHRWDKIIAAPDDGAAKCQPWLSVGDVLWWNDWPVAFFTDPKKYKIQALVHQDMISLLKIAPVPPLNKGGLGGVSENEAAQDPETLENPEALENAEAPENVETPENAENAAVADTPEDDKQEAQQTADQTDVAVDESESKEPPTEFETPSMRIAATRTRVATADVQISSAAGVTLDGQIASIGNSPVELTRGKPMWYWGEEKRGKDLIAREVMIRIDSDSISALRLGETVECTAWIEAGEEMHAIPAHLVAEGKERCVVMLDGSGEEREVEGFHVGQHFIVTKGLDENTRLREPIGVVPDQRTGRRTFPGEVVAGERQQVGIPYSWGRIKDMVEDGSDVEKGQLIVTLYNPRLEADREKIKEEKVKARQDYLVAIEERRVKTLEAQWDHDQKIVEEHDARIAVRALVESDPVALARAESASKHASFEAELKQNRYDRLSSMDSSLADLENARIARGKSVLTMQRAAIAEIMSRRQTDWLKLNDARRTWLDVVDSLSLREVALRVLRKEEQVARMASELRLQNAMEGDRHERRFERVKNIKAPVSGRLFYLTAWNSHAKARTKIKKDFNVWSGMPIAEILDMNTLGMEAELSEELYPQISLDTAVVVGLTQFSGVEIEARFERIGKSFYQPKELTDTRHGDQLASVRRVFSVTVLFSPPSELAEHLTPGTKGYLYLP